MDAAERKEILSRYMDHQRRFEAVAAKRQNGNAEVIPFNGPLRELEQEPTMREIEVLQLISDGLVNREIGHRLFLSEETVKSHVRHLLAKLQARSRAHAVAVGFRRGIIGCRPSPPVSALSSRPRGRPCGRLGRRRRLSQQRGSLHQSALKVIKTA